MKTLLLFTSNQNKINELKALAPKNWRLMGYLEVVKNKLEPIEDGKTFEENALIKVKALPQQNDYWTLAEDSGIEVDALDKRPGIHSARYAGPNATRDAMCQKLLRELGTTQNRSARYKAVIALRSPDGNITTFDGTVEGQIGYEMRGENGFGYDPIFIPEGYTQTFGELDKTIKQGISHRVRAFQQAMRFL